MSTHIHAKANTHSFSVTTHLPRLVCACHLHPSKAHHTSCRALQTRAACLRHPHASPATAFCSIVIALTTGDMPALSAMLAAVLSLRKGSSVCSTCAAEVL